MIAPCPGCGTPASGEDRFCRNCGTALDVQAAGTRPDAAAPDITTTQRRLVTVLFADLVGFTGRSEHADPEDVARFLADYFERSHDVITRFGGLVEKYIGDAVMAVWGARTANEDDAERAVRAGLELQDTIAKLAAEAGDPDIALRVGILSGEAAVRAGGNATTGMIVGDLVNAASRLQEIAEPGTVWVGPTTHRAASRAIAFEPTGEHTVRGRAEPLTTWRAVRVVAERGGRGRVEGIDPPFVGRIAELQMLKDVLGAVVQTNRSRLVSIIGEAGIGKSALVWELRKYSDGLATNIYWNRGRSLSYGAEGIAYRAVSDMLRGRLGVAESDPPEVVAGALDATLDRFVPNPTDRHHIRPWLASVLGIAGPPDGDRSEFDAAIRSFIGHMAESGPTVLVFDDLHWGDAGLLDLVEQLTDWMPGSPVLVIAIARPELLERRPGWGSGRAGVISLRLGPLPDEYMGALVQGVMGELDPALEAQIIDRAAGVPLYAVELTRALMGDGQAAPGAARTMRNDLADVGIPETLQSLIGSRIDRLDATSQMILQNAAVLGHSFTLDGLAALTRLEEEVLKSQLTVLMDHELIEPIRDQRSPLRGGNRFVQKLVRQVARNRMSRAVRRTRHLAAAEYFERRAEPDSAPVAADHYLSALELTRDGDDARQLRRRASGVLLAALERAASLYAHEEILSLGSRILGLEFELPLDEQARVKERMAVSASSLLHPEDAARYGQEAVELSRQCGDIGGVRRSTALLAFVYLEHLRAESAIEILSAELTGVDDLTTDPELPRLAGLAARAAFLQGRYDDAIAAADRALAAAEELDLKAVVGDALVTKATSVGVLGRPIEARLLLQSIIDFAKRYELNAVALRAYLNLGALVPPSELAGDPTREAIELGRRLGNRNFMLLAKGNLTVALVFRAEWDELEAQLDDPLWQWSDTALADIRRWIGAIVEVIRTGRSSPLDQINDFSFRIPEDTTTFRRFGEQSIQALARLLAGDRSAALQWAHGSLDAIDQIPWVDGTARILFLAGAAGDVLRLADRVRSRRQTSDDRLGPFLRNAARAHRGDDRALSDAFADIARLDVDGVVVERAIWMIGLGRLLEIGSPTRARLMQDVRGLIAERDMGGLLPFVDPAPAAPQEPTEVSSLADRP
jgi:class 3 adenylate cyclase/tetratricopeptide (TPR) repeat protein